ncbi:winged helix-turn-helix domain-containing protein [Agaribacterium sp. ZY112]|uniref:winged helix-turn-helix domain-containing protein n=1 Tax=Agaribacterium sp. ZY112 TaxID=3233574 RepID=UPI003524ADE7
MSEKKVQKLSVGLWHIDPEALSLTKGQQQESLRLKAMDLLLYMASHPAEVIARDELISAVWPETSATDDTLNSTIAKLRKVLVADDLVPKYIETIPKKGYRLLAPVHFEQKPSEQETQTEPERAISSGAASLKRSAGKRLMSPALLASFAGFFLLLVVLLILVLVLSPFKEPPNSLARPVYQASIVAAEEQGEAFPALSHKNDKAAFIRADKNLSNVRIVVKDLSSGEERVVNDKPGLYSNPVWSPDDEQIAYFSFEGARCSVRLVSSSGGPSRELALCSPALLGTLRTSMDWLPSGKHLLIPQLAEGTAVPALYMLNIETGDSIQLSFPADDLHGDANPRVSPDTRLVAFTRSSATGQDQLGLIDLVTGKERMFERSFAKVLGLDWMTHNEIILVSDLSGRAETWLFNIDSEELSWLGLGGHDVAHVDYDYRSQSMLISEIEIDSNIRLRTLANKKLISHPSFSSSQNEHAVTISNGGKRLAFARQLGERTELWLSDLDKSEFGLRIAGSALLKKIPNAYISNITWSPDDKALVLQVLQEGGSSLYVYEFENQNWYRLSTPVEQDAFSPVWGPRGERIYYSVPSAPSWQMWVYQRDQAKAELVLQRAGGLLQRDGERILFSRYAEPGLWSIDVSDMGTVSATNLRAEKLAIADKAMFRSWLYRDGILYYIDLSEAYAYQIYKQKQAGERELFFSDEHAFAQFDIRGDLFVASEFHSYEGDVYLYTRSDSNKP